MAIPRAAVAGRGWNEEGALHGRIYFRLGDGSGFRAERVEGEATRASKSAVGSHRLR